MAVSWNHSKIMYVEVLQTKTMGLVDGAVEIWYLD
jgi:hypothetical protein